MMNKLAKPTRKQSKVHRSLLLGSFSALGLLAVSTVTAGAKAVNVGTGDTVWGIAQREGLSTTKIEEANPSISHVTNSIDLIFAGQQLQLPTAASLNQTLSQQGLYTVQKGDTLSRIAKHFNVTVSQLKAWNHLNSDLIYVGQQLAVNVDSAKLVAPEVSTASAVTTDETATSTISVQPAKTVAAQPATSQAPVSAAPASAVAIQSAAPAQLQSAANTSVAPAASATTSDTNMQTSIVTAAQTGSTSTASNQSTDSAVASQASQSTSQEVAQQPAGADEDVEATTQSAGAATQTVSVTPAQSAATTSGQSTQSLNGPSQQTNSSANWAQMLDTSFVEVPAQSAAQSSAASSAAPSLAVSSVAQSSQAPVSQATQSTAAQQQSQAQQTSQATSQTTSAASNSSDLQTGSVVSLAVKLANSNIPYVWGGNSLSGMDCSGLVDYVYAHATGKQLPHYTVALESCVNQHPVSQAQAGDLLFWGQHGATYHTAIYIGNSQYVAAPQPGQNVQIQSISQYFMPSFAGTVK